MAWPSAAVATGELITAAQMNGLPVRIADTTLGASAASIDFTSIPGHYAHLMVVGYLRGDTAADETGVFLRFNGDTGANYDAQYMLADAATVVAAEGFGATRAQIGNCAAGNAGANLFSALTLDITHYAQATNNKSLSSMWARKYGTTTADIEIGSFAGFWRSSAAINQLTLVPGAGNFVSGCRATIYGLA